MYIKDVIMEGFKCYTDRTAIRNLDRNFTAITGMNGSGKSNIIDAVIFALDLNSAKYMRVSSLKELINIHKKECMVTVVFSNEDKMQSPSGYEHYNEIEVSRHMDSDSKSKYRINNHSCTKATVEKLCRSIGISNDFIVMQGHITKILNMKPIELRDMIEETAGTRSYNSEKEKSKDLLNKKEVKLREAQDHLKRRISPFFSQLMNEKKIYDENREFEATREKMVQELENLENLKSLHILTRKIEDLENLLKSYETDKKDLFSIEEKLKQINESGTEEDLVELKAKINEEKIKVEDLSNSGTKRILEEKIAELKETEIVSVSHNKHQLAEKEALLSKELCNGFSLDKMADLESLKSKEGRVYAEIKDLQREISRHFSFPSETDFVYKYSLGKVFGDANPNRISDLIKEFVEFGDDQQIFNGRNHAHKQSLIESTKSLKSLFVEIINNAENIKKKKSEHEKRLQYLRSKISYPFKPGVYGTVDELFELRDERYREAISTILSGRTKYIVCETEDIAGEILKSSERKVSCIPINKISYTEGKSLPISGISAIEAINYDRKYERAFKHLFSPFYIFSSKEEASECCFTHNVLTVTLEGTVYDPKGTLTGGKSVYSTEVIRRTEIEYLEKQIEQGEYVDNDLDRMKHIAELLERFLQLHMLKDDLHTKVMLLESICGGKMDVKAELESVRKDLIEATREENLATKQRERSEKLEREIEQLRSANEENEQQLAECVKRLGEMQAMLQERELKNSSKRLSVRMIEGLDVKRRNLVKSTVKISSRIAKVHEEILELYDSRSGFNDCKENIRENKKPSENHLNYKSPNSNKLVNETWCEEFCINPSIFMLEKKILLAEDLQKIEEKITEITEKLSRRSKRITMDPRSFELLEKNVAAMSELQEKILQLEKDKTGITETIEKLNELGQSENKKAFNHINSSLGPFLRYFIPGADALITDQFEIKVKIGSWKNSLAELSGGQRSLIALCLIFSMLTYRPAPFYIFDEIDAALDLNYTQKMGEVILNEFKNAQFIVVSLKNNMFDNANKIFRVFIQDQKSKISQIN